MREQAVGGGNTAVTAPAATRLVTLRASLLCEL